MIDSGHNATTGWFPGNHLKSIGVSRIEQLVITNLDEDHLSGFPNLLSSVSVDWFLSNPTVPPSTIRHLKSEDGMGRGIDALVRTLSNCSPPSMLTPAPTFDGVHLEWFWNPYPHFDDENNLSLVFNLKVQGFSFLFPGDLECAGFENMLRTCKRFREVVSTVDVLVASHHGRESGICREMFDQWSCKPKLVVISDDHKKFDTQETASYYASKCHGISGFRAETGTRRVLTTRTDGEITFSFRGGNCFVG